MGMKLMSPFQNRDKQQEEQTRKILRIQEIEDLATKANANLAKAQAEFNTTLALNRSKWALEEEEHAQRIKDMTSEVEALEERKKQALIPISMYKEEADKIMVESQDILKRSKEKEEQVDYLQEKLEEKLTEVSDRENQVVKEEQKQQIARQGIEEQQKQTKLGIERLSKEMVMFHEKQQYEDTKLLERKKVVELAEINFEAKIDRYNRNMEALLTREVQLIDREKTLERNMNRL